MLKVGLFLVAAAALAGCATHQERAAVVQAESQQLVASQNNTPPSDARLWRKGQPLPSSGVQPPGTFIEPAVPCNACMGTGANQSSFQR